MLLIKRLWNIFVFVLPKLGILLRSPPASFGRIILFAFILAANHAVFGEGE